MTEAQLTGPVSWVGVQPQGRPAHEPAVHLAPCLGRILKRCPDARWDVVGQTLCQIFI